MTEPMVVEFDEHRRIEVVVTDEGGDVPQITVVITAPYIETWTPSQGDDEGDVQRGWDNELTISF